MSEQPSSKECAIVPSLRKCHAETVAAIGHVMGDDTSTVYQRAADEIERLQRHVSELEAERNALGHFVELNADMIVHGIAACVTADELPEPPAVQPSNQQAATLASGINEMNHSNETQQAALKKQFYRVEPSANDDPACAHCVHGQFWTVVYDEDGPTEIGTSWGDKELADDICDLMNMAFDQARAVEDEYRRRTGRGLGDPEPPDEPLRPDGMPDPSLDVLKRVAERMRVNAPDTAYLAEWAVEQIEEHEQSFDLRWKADMRAIKRWQEAHPGNDLTWPDHVDLCVWLLEQLDARASQPPSDDLVADLSMMIRRLVQRVRKFDGHDVIAGQAMILLTQHHLHGSILRDAPTKAAAPPSDDRQASYDAANDRSHPWYWIQQYAVTDPHMGLRKAVQIAWDMAHPATKSACCRQSPCLHPGVGPCDMPAVEKSAALEDVTGKPACLSCGWVEGHADYCGREAVETLAPPADETVKQPNATQEIYAHAKAITKLTETWPDETPEPLTYRGHPVEFAPAMPTTEKDGCQHDLQKPNHTIERNPLHNSVRCTVCRSMWTKI